MSLLIATFPETKHIAHDVARSLKAKCTEIFVEDFPDSEFHLALKKDPKNKTVVIMGSLCNDPDNKLIESILAGGIAKDYGAKRVILMATYFPYLRQDRHFFKYDSFSSKHIMRLMINFDHIITIDPHLHRIKKMSGFSYKAQCISANKLIADYIKKRFKNNFTIVGPDEESAQWSRPIAKMLGQDVIVLKKTRFSSTRISVRQDEAHNYKKNVIIIDDIISTGRTLVGALKLAKKQGAQHLVCIGIHGLLVKGADSLITKHAELITSNTIPNRYADITVAPIIVEALRKYC